MAASGMGHLHDSVARFPSFDVFADFDDFSGSVTS
jgi:hypothetical protein